MRSITWILVEIRYLVWISWIGTESQQTIALLIVWSTTVLIPT
jgi:hypothetical protein